MNQAVVGLMLKARRTLAVMRDLMFGVGVEDGFKFFVSSLVLITMWKRMLPGLPHMPLCETS